MTVAENMGFGLRMNGAPAQEIEQKVQKAAETLQLGQLLDRKPKNLSGGQRQRVAIGRAIVRDPKVFLFDEPFSNLDAELRVEMRLQIARLHKQLDATMIYVTHDQVEAMTMADKIVVLRAGVVEQVGSPLELYRHPSNLFVAGFIGSPRMNFIEASVLEPSAEMTRIKLADDNVLSIPVDSSRASAGDPVTLGLRPEDLKGQSGNVQLTLNVDVAERLGGTTYLYGTCAGLENFVVEREGDDLAAAGESVSIAVPHDKAYLFDQDGLAFKRH
jgi:ABC-type sugar transport system ATPase subunit